MLENFLREYNVNRVFLSISGLWLFQNKNIKNSLRTVCLLMEISYYPFEILLLYDHWGDSQMVVDACYQFIFTTAFTARILHNIWNQDKLQQLCIAIDKHWGIFTSDVEVQIMKHYAMLSRRFTTVFSNIIMNKDIFFRNVPVLLFFIVLIFVTIPLVPVLLDTVLPLNESRPRVFAIEIEFRVNKDDYFLIIFCYTTIVIIIGINILIGVDSMHIACTAHACSLFAAVSKQIENIISKSYNNNKISKCKYRVNMELNPFTEEIIYREYIICLKKYQLALEFVNILESSFQGLSLLLLLLILGNMSLIGVRYILTISALSRQNVQREKGYRQIIIIKSRLWYQGAKLGREPIPAIIRVIARTQYSREDEMFNHFTPISRRSNDNSSTLKKRVINLIMTPFNIGKINKIYTGERVLVMLANFLREYNINRVFLSISGLWLFQSKNVRNSLRTICLLMEISYYPFEILLLYDHWDDPQMVFDACYQFIFTTAFIARVLHNIWNQDKLQQLCIAIDKHWDIFTNDVEVRIMKDYVMLSRRFTIVFSMLLFFTVLIFVTIPLIPVLLDTVLPLNESRPRVFAIEVEFRVNKNDYFLIMFCYTTVVVIIGLNISIGVDTMHFACTAHACSLFAAVSKQIENIISKAYNNNKVSKCGHHVNMELNPFNERIIYREYITCLKKHQLALEFVNILESSFQGLSLLLLLLILGNISLIGVRILYVLNQMQQLIKFTFMFTAMLIDLMIICYSGQRLMDESQDIFYRAYAAEWYKFSPRLKSLLMMTLYRSNIPCGLKAGNMIPLSIATYAAVVRIAMSYFTAFKSFSE
ncbi:OR33A protein, partial [Acromyrmex heyeri]